jgi:hypothetical protein
MEFPTLQSFLLVRSRDAFRRPLPSCHSPPVAESAEDAICLPRLHDAIDRTGGVERGFKAFISGARALTWPRRLRRDPLAALLGFGSLQGSPSATARRVLPSGILPRAFEPPARGFTASAARPFARCPGSPES